jgi:hypothetical protein
MSLRKLGDSLKGLIKNMNMQIGNVANESPKSNWETTPKFQYKRETE